MIYHQSPALALIAALLFPAPTMIVSPRMLGTAIFKFDIGCGGAANCTTFTQMIATGVPTEQPTRALAGVAIYGELTASCPDRSPALPTPELARAVVPRLDPARQIEGSVTRFNTSAMIGRCPSGSFCLAR